MKKMNVKNALETIMGTSAVDSRRIELMHGIGASDDEVGYHTAYEWADAVTDLLTMLEKRINSLIKIHEKLYSLDDAQNSVQSSIDHITREVEIEAQILGEFWAREPEDFDRLK